MRSQFAVLIVAIVPAIPLTAQSMSLAVAASTTASAQAGANQQIVPLPAGPLPSQGGIWANAAGASGSCSAELTWSASQPGTLQLFLTASANVASSPGQAAVAPVDILVDVTSPYSASVTFELTRSVVGSPGTAVPFGRVDIGDDGTFELDETSPSPVEVVTTVGPTPLIIRCRISADAAVPGVIVSSLQIAGRPGNTLVSPMLLGCSSTYSVVPRFDGNLEFWANATTAAFSVAVFGLATQPLLLGSLPQFPGGPLMPCILMPRPDFFVLLPNLAPQLLVVPAAARPITLYSQLVDVQPLLYPTAAFATSTTFQILAY